MNFTRPKLLLSLLLLAVVGLLASGNILAQDPSVTGINVRPNAQTGHYPILLDDMDQGLNSVDVILTEQHGTTTNGNLTVNLSISWPGQIGGPLVLTQTLTNYTFDASGVHTISYSGAWLKANGFTFDRRIIYTLNADFTFSGLDMSMLNNASAAPRMVAPAFSKAKITIDYRTGSTTDFNDFNYMGQYLTYSGLLGDLEISVSSGTFSSTHTTPSNAAMIIDGSWFSNDDGYKIYIHGMKNYPQNTIIRDPAGDYTTQPWLWKFINVNVDVRYFTFILEDAGSYYEGGQALNFENTTSDFYGYHVEGNVFNYDGDIFSAGAGFETIYCNGDYVDHFYLHNNKFYGNWASVYMDNDANPTPVGTDIRVTNNEFWNFTTYGVYLDRPAVTTPGYNGGLFTNNAFVSLADFNGAALMLTNMSIIQNNTFNLDGTGLEYAINIVHAPTYYPEVMITNNTFTGTEYGAMSVTNSRRSIITDNNINIVNAGISPAIVINGGGSDLFTNYTHIQDNTINMTAEGSGILIFGNNYHKVYYNSITVASGGSANGRFGLQVFDSRGIVSTNLIQTTFAEGIFVVIGQDENIFYNTVIVNGAGNTDGAFWIDDLGTGKLVAKRNMFANLGGGAGSYAILVDNAPVITAEVFLDQNNYYATGGNFGFRTSAVTTIANWRLQSQTLPGGLTTNDVGSTIAPAAWITRDGGQVYTYAFYDDDVDPLNVGIYTGTFFETPLFPAIDPLFGEFENSDFFGTTRIGYYAGYTNVHPVVSIVTQPSDIFSCKGEDWQLQTVANVTLNSHAVYQWYKDGVILPGETNATLLLNDLNWEDAGKYQATVTGLGGAAPVLSYEVIVVVVGKTSITRQPFDQLGSMNGTVVFEVEAHTHGFPPFDPDFPSEIYNPKYQWYQVINGVGVPLVDNDDYEYNNIAGAKSSILSIANLNTDAWTQPIEVYCEVLGYCDYEYDLLSNKVWEWTRSNNVKILAPPSLTIDNQPVGADLCEGTEASMKIDVTIAGDADATYQWKKDGVALTNNARISGATTNELKINPTTPGDVGDYMVEIVFNGEIINSDDATLVVNTKPTITTEPVAVTAETGKPFDLWVEAQGFGTLTYQWQKDAADINGETSATFSVAAAQASDAGDYKCIVTNECGVVESEEVAVAVTIKEEPNDVDDAVAGGFVLLNNVPNPFTEATIISFLSPFASSVRLSVSDLFGREVAVYNITANQGLNTFDFNASNARLSSGIYNYTIESNGVKLTKQLIISR